MSLSFICCGSTRPAELAPSLMRPVGFLGQSQHGKAEPIGQDGTHKMILMPRQKFPSRDSIEVLLFSGR
jgi:hypothetical protein